MPFIFISMCEQAVFKKQIFDDFFLPSGKIMSHHRQQSKDHTCPLATAALVHLGCMLQQAQDLQEDS